MRTARRRVYWIAGLGFIVAGVILLAGLGWAKYRRVRTCADSTLTGLNALQELAPAGSLEISDLAGLGVQLHGLQDDLACLRAESGELIGLAPLLGWLPKVGNDVASAPDLLEMAESLATAGV
ncbi:MAG: hypothetical protein GWN58_14440, partial [Anaerolineae bacterium]|nr:hypothetical protein [Anaerolineae bacterium]